MIASDINITLRNADNGFTKSGNKAILPVKIPYIKRNKDYTMVLTELELSFPIGYVEGFFGNYPYNNYQNKITVEYQNQKIFYGFLSSYSTNILNGTVDCKFKSDLWLLKNLNVSSNLNLYSGNPNIGQTTTELYTDNDGFTYFQIPYLLKRLFYEVGLGLDITQVLNVNHQFDVSTYIPCELLKVDLGMLMCINQPLSAHWLDIINEPGGTDFRSNELDAFEFVSFICSVFGWSITINPSTGFYTIYPYQDRDTRNYTIDNSQLYDFSQERFDAEVDSTSGISAVSSLGDDANTGAIIPSQERLAYITQGDIKTPRQVVNKYLGNGEEKVQLKNHFMVIKQNGYSSPPIHDLTQAANTRYLVTRMIQPRYSPHYVQKLKKTIDISKPCVLSNTLVVSKNGVYSLIEQEDML